MRKSSTFFKRALAHLRVFVIMVSVLMPILAFSQITINTSTTTATVNSSGDPVIVSGSGYLKSGDINNWLGDGISVIVQTSGDITVSESITKSGGGNCYLTLKANGSIWTTDNKTISSSSGALSLVFWADADGGGAGSGTIDLQCDITTNGGGVWMGGGDGSASWTPYSGASALTVGDGSATGLVNKNGIDFYGEATIATGAGNVSINGEYSLGTVGGTGFSSFDNTKINTTTGNVEITGINNNNQNVGVWTRTAITTSSGNISMTGSGYNWEWGGLNSDWGLMLYSSSGNITLDGTNNHPSGPSIRFGNHTNLGEVGMVGYNNSDIPSSTSDVIFRGDRFVLGTSSINTSGTFTIEPKSASFPSAFTWPSNLSLVSTVSGLTIGKSTNTANVTLGNALTIAGPITVYGGDISVNADLTTTYSSGTGALLKASGSIMQAAGVDVTTGGGSVIFWADADANSDGMVFLNTISITTNGGHLWMGGGAASGTSWNGLTVGNGYAVGNGTMSSGIGIYASTITTSGGNMAMYGKAGELALALVLPANTDGIRLNGGNSVNSGTGTIYWKGIAQTAAGGGTSANGIELSSDESDLIKSENTTADAIYMYGESANATALNAWGIYSWDNTIEATGAGGGITLEGKGYKHNGVTITSGGSLLAASGPITLNGLGHGTGYYAVQIDGNVGSKDGSDVTSSSSQIVVNGDNFTGSGTINTSGTFTIEPKSNSFESSFSWPSNLQLASTVSGLTIGKDGNTADISLATALDIAGPLSLYGGTVTASSNTTCTNLVVNTGTTLNFDYGSSLITNGTITNNGTINISHFVAIDNKWHLISMPNNSTTANTFLDMYLQSWDEENKEWVDITNAAETLTPVKGYSLWCGDSKGPGTTFTYSGTPNTGNQPISLLYHDNSEQNDGANLVGNPYPSYLDWDEVNGYGTKYTWNGADYDERTKAGAGEGSRYVAPMEGFFVVTGSSGNTFTLTNAMRTHNSAKKEASTLSNGIVLSANSQNYSDALYIVFDESANENFELPRDAWKFISGTTGICQIWSQCPDGNLAVDVRPETESIQLGFANNEAGTYSIGIQEIADISTAILEDTKLNIFHDLSEGAYSFDWRLNDDETRFKLHLSTTAVSEINGSAVQAYVAGGNIIIQSNQQLQRILLTDITGRTLGVWEHTETIPAPKTAGVYLVTVASGNQMLTKKIIIE